MKKFIFQLVLFCISPLPFLYLLNYITDAGMHKSRFSYFAVWNDLFDGKINADVIINGSSRAWAIFSPKIVDTVLHTNSYIIGLDGSDFHMQYSTLMIYLSHNRKPKYIIQEVGYVKTLVRYQIPAATVQFLPYLADSSVWDIVKSTYSSFTWRDRNFPLYKYNNELDLVKEGIACYFGRGAKELKYKGFMPFTANWGNEFNQFKASHPKGWLPEISEESIAEFGAFLDFCKKNDIKVIMVYPPVYYKATQMLNPAMKQEINNIYNRFSKEYGFPYYNYERDTLCNSTAYFFNSQHLNKKGAELFSLEFARDLKKDVSIDMGKN